ncbi:MAG: carboxypeptidase M32 [Chloroflexota bacterium]
METKIEKFKTILAEVIDLSLAAAVLAWDQQVNMPPGGARERGNQLATLKRLAHIKFTSPEMGELLNDLQEKSRGLDPDSDDARIVKITLREYQRETKVPTDFVAEFAMATSQAHQVWQEARAQSDFKKFQPLLERIVELSRQYAEFFAPYNHVYDPLLDHYEPGMKTADVQAIFDALRPKQVELIQLIKERPQVDDSFLHQPYDEKKQWDFSTQVITRFGYDWSRGRQDKATHPFTTHFSVDDVRITTRVDPNFLNQCLFATMHECGHALYGQGVDPYFERTLLTNGASLAVHESQSRMWENLIGRSRDMWVYFYPKLQETFPKQLGSVDLDTFYKGINKVEPSYIRVEADEATYNLHIMLRLELEIALIEGSLEVRDLPDAWNSRMQKYLGLTPPNDALGVLQDVHWSSGYFGYFSTYALGNLISLQLWENIQSDIPNLKEQMRRGDFSNLLEWTREKIHRPGGKFEPQEIVERVTGSKITSEPYVRYLRNKFGEIYRL